MTEADDFLIRDIKQEIERIERIKRSCSIGLTQEQFTLLLATHTIMKVIK